MTRAIIFDLDETLYRERRWLLSGFAALSHAVVAGIDGSSTRGAAIRADNSRSAQPPWSGPVRDVHAVQVDESDVFRALVIAVRRGHRAEALQRVCDQYGLPRSSIPEFVQCIRSHRPRLRLAPAVRAMLVALRTRWRVGVLTNGPPAVQARKVAALGLEWLVDAVVYATRYGAGKPDPLSFREVAARLGVEERQSIFVGDDPWSDIFGARRVGMRTVWIRRRRHDRALPACDADRVITRVTDVAMVAEQMLPASEPEGVR